MRDWALLFAALMPVKVRHGGKDEYAHSLPSLYCIRDDEGKLLKIIGLIDQHFPEAWGPDGTAKDGHLYRELTTIAGRPVDWEKDFALCATPAAYDRCGFWTFVVKTDGQVWGRGLGCSAFVIDFPAEPEKSGWRLVW